MPDQMSLAEFGQKIKAKYPQYGSLADEDLANKVIAKYPQYKSSIKVAPPAPHTLRDQLLAWRSKVDQSLQPGNQPGDKVTGPVSHAINEIGKGGASGIVSPFLHPIQTGESLLKQTPPGQIYEEIANKGQPSPEDVGTARLFKEHPLYAAASAIVPSLALHAVTGAPEGIANTVETIKNLPETIREGVQGKFAPEAASKAVEKFGEASEEHRGIAVENQAKALKHKSEVEKSLQVREGSEHAVALRKEAEQDLQSKTNNYFAKEAEVKADAKSQENDAWEPWHQKAKDAELDVDDLAEEVDKNPEIKPFLDHLVPDAADAAPESLYAQDRAAIMKSQGYQGTYWDQPPKIRAIIDSIAKSSGFEPDPVDFNPAKGKTMSLERIHQAKSILGWKLATREYAGVTEGKMKLLYNKLAAKEARGSAQVGALPELEAAKQATQDYQKAFGRERNPRATVGETREKQANREALAEEKEEARLNAAAKYDPSLVEDYNAVREAKNRVKQFPTEEQARKSLKPPPDRPTEKPNPQPEVPKIDEATREVLEKNLKKYGQTGAWVWRLIAGGVAKYAIHGGMGGEFAGDILLGQGALKLFTNVLRKDSVLDWLSKPTRETLEQIDKLPPEDAEKLRNGLTALAAEELRDGKATHIPIGAGQILGPKNLAALVTAIGAQGRQQLLNKGNQAINKQRQAQSQDNQEDQGTQDEQEREVDKQKPMITEKSPEDEPEAKSYERNKQWAKPGPYITKLSPEQEKEFRKWIKDKKVNWKESEKGYDMRGFWLAAQHGDPDADTNVNPVDHKLHFSDKWKTPYDATFSNQSMYATPNAPHWVGNEDRWPALVTYDGKLVLKGEL